MYLYFCILASNIWKKYLKSKRLIIQSRKQTWNSPFNIESENILRSRKGNEHSSCAKIQSNNTTATQRKVIFKIW